MKGTLIVSLESVMRDANQAQTQINGRWVPARSLGLTSLRERLQAAWLVFTGRADALVWPEGQ